MSFWVFSVVVGDAVEECANIEELGEEAKEETVVLLSPLFFLFSSDRYCPM